MTELETISPEERFQNFLRDTQTEKGDAFKYRQKLAQAAVSGERFLVVDFSDLLIYDESLAKLILESPDRYLQNVNRAAFSQLRMEDPDYAEKLGKLTVRFRDIPHSIPLRKVGSTHIGNLIMVEGILVRASSIKPLLTRAAFRCRRCEAVQFVEQSGIFLNRPLNCINPSCRERSPPQLVESESDFINSQEIRIQERPEDLPPGQLPRTLDVKLTDELVDVARPGDRVSAIGVVRAYQESTSRGSRLRTFDMYLEGNHIDVAGREAEIVRITPEEERQITDLAKDPWIYRNIIRSIAPSIYGYDDIKEAVTLLLFGGLHKTMPDGVSIRGDVNALLIGDPGTAKSQLLQYVSRIAARGLYTSGRGTTAAGLTAAVLRERAGGMALEAGALVLADKGVCCIDEFDKMRAEDRVAIHEAMEQQSYHPCVEILLADGRKVQIGEFVDSLFQNYKERMVLGRDCQILPVNDLNIEIVSLDNETNDRILPIDRVSRHEAPNEFIRISYSNGRSILVTPEHPVFVFKNGRIDTVPAERVNVGIFIPGVRALRVAEPSDAVGLNGEISPREKYIKIPKEISKDLCAALGYLVSEGYSYCGSSSEVGFANTEPLFLKEMSGLMASCFSIVPLDYSSVNRTQRYVSSRLYRYLALNFEPLLNKSKEKRVPASILTADESRIAEFLRTAFNGDGCVESVAACYRTSCRGLAEDYADLLLRLGICSRIVVDRHNQSYKVYITGDSLPLFLRTVLDKKNRGYSAARILVDKGIKNLRGHDTIPTECARSFIRLYKMLGIPYDGYFYSHLKHSYGINRKVAIERIGKLRDRLQYLWVNIHRTQDFRVLRQLLGWSQAVSADLLGLARGSVDYLERGGYASSRREAIFSDFRNRVIDVLETVEEELDRLEGISNGNIRWLRVSKIERVKNAGELRTSWTYDVTVEPNHNFVSHGLLLHNTVSIAKGGIVATLNARTSILAAANPSMGRYDPYRTVADNINLPVTVLSRFDLIFILRDEPEKELDTRMSEHILALHGGKAVSAEATIPPDLLRKYITYARRIRPALTEEATQRFQDFYLMMRSRSEGADTSIAITPRQLEALIRLSEARARACLRDVVTVEDAEGVISLMKKCLEQVGIDVSTGEYDIDIIMTGKPKTLRDKLLEVLSSIGELEMDVGMAKQDDLLDHLETEHNIDRNEAERLVSQLQREGTIYSPKPGFLKRT